MFDFRPFSPPKFLIVEGHEDWAKWGLLDRIYEIFMAFYNEEFGGEKGLKSNISVLRILDQYDRDTRTFRIGGKQIELTVEDVDLSRSHKKKISHTRWNLYYSLLKTAT